eukprot:UN4720
MAKTPAPGAPHRERVCAVPSHTSSPMATTGAPTRAVGGPRNGPSRAPHRDPPRLAPLATRIPPTTQRSFHTSIPGEDNISIEEYVNRVAKYCYITGESIEDCASLPCMGGRAAAERH